MARHWARVPLYFNKVLPRIGQWLSGAPIRPTLTSRKVWDLSPKGKKCLSWIREAGWEAAKYRYFTFGNRRPLHC